MVLGLPHSTVAWSLLADRYGRRRTISTMAVLMAIGGVAFAVTDSFAILVLAGFTGTISATNSEVDNVAVDARSRTPRRIVQPGAGDDGRPG